MVDVFDDWYVHRVDVDTLLAVSDDGTWTIQAHADVHCWIEDGSKLVRSDGGAQVVSSSRLSVSLGDAGLFTPGSTVRVRGRSSEVLSVDIADSVVGDDLDGATVVLA